MGIAVGVTAFVALVAGGAYFAFASGAMGSAAAAATSAPATAAVATPVAEVAMTTTNPLASSPSFKAF